MVWAATEARIECRWVKKASRALSAEAIVVERVGGYVPEEVGPGALGPGGDVDEGGGLAEPGGQQEAEDASVGEGKLGVWGQGAVNDGCDVEVPEQRSDEGQGAEVQGFVRDGGSVPGIRHKASVS